MCTLIRRDGVIAYATWMKKLGHAFLKALRADGSFALTPELLTSPIAQAMVSLSRNMDSVRTPEIVRWVLSVHEFLGKLPLTRPDLEDAARSKWCLTQHDVFDIDAMDFSIIEPLRHIVTWLVGTSIPKELLHGRHGPGNTNVGAKTIDDKERLLVPIFQAQLINPLYDGPSIVSRRLAQALPRPECALYADVDKDIGSRRSITQEGVDMMRGQQALKQFLYDATDKGRINLGRFVRFSDQTLSRKAAIRGSKNAGSEYADATLDMQRASDLVSSDLVAFLFSGDLLHYLMLARTWDVLLPKKSKKEVDLVVQARMYAGMGSACTFPVQTIIFTALCILASLIAWSTVEFGGVDDLDLLVDEFLLQEHSLEASHPRLRRYLNTVRVYGDDLIVADKVVPHLRKLIASCGLIVNDNKSFTGTDAVRESCGIYAYCGYDITPLRYRVPQKTEDAVDFAVFDGTRQYANNAYIKGYRALSRSIVRRLICYKPFANDRDLQKSWFLANGLIERPEKPGVVQEDGRLLAVHQPARERNVEYIRFTEPQILFEPYRGPEATYTGVISSRTNEYDLTLYQGEVRLYVTSYSAKAKSDRISEDSYGYSLDQKFFRHLFDEDPDNDPVLELFPTIPRGQRIVTNIALLAEAGENTWVWASKGKG